MTTPARAAPLFVTTFRARSTAGEGGSRTILCLHGIEAHGLRFFGLARMLPEATIVAPDLRGHGQSPKIGPWTMAQHLRDLLPILEGLGPRPIVLGHSYGGLIAWELARAAPDRLSGLVLVDPAIEVTPELAQEGSAAAASNLRWPDPATALRDLSADRLPHALWAIALDVAVASQREDDGSLRPVVVADAIHAGWQHMTVTLRPTDYGGPTLLLEARRESGRYISTAVVARMSAQLGDRLKHVLLDVTHTIPSDHPDLLAEHVRRFLTALI